MTEQEWLSKENWLKLLNYVGTRTQRKTLLFLVAACRRIAHQLVDPRILQKLEVCECCADEEVTKDDWEKVERSANAATSEITFYQQPSIVRSAACAVVSLNPEPVFGFAKVTDFVSQVYGCEAAVTAGVLSQDAQHEDAQAVVEHSAFLSGMAEGERIHADLFREVIGNPFRPTALDTAWLAWNDATVRHIAQAIYDARAFERMPILADALEDAGCDNADILNHCRSGGEHVRGCWVVDLLLGKT